MATAVTNIDTDELAVRQFLQSLFHKQAVAVSQDASAAADERAAAATAMPATAGAGYMGTAAAAAPILPLRLHPRVDAAHPLGTAHTAEELEAALKLYSQMVASMSLEVDDVLMGPDKALATGHLVVMSHASTLAAAGVSAVTATTAALPDAIKVVADTVIPAGLKPGRVPITIQMRLGKNDAGDAVVTHMSLVFSLLSVLLPHVELNPWQQQMATQSQPALLSLLQQMGAAATVAEDTMTSVGASWRAGTAVLQATVGQVLSAAKTQAQHMWTARTRDTTVQSDQLGH